MNSNMIASPSKNEEQHLLESAVRHDGACLTPLHPQAMWCRGMISFQHHRPTVVGEAAVVL
jgi:hypothetical protein